MGNIFLAIQLLSSISFAYSDCPELCLKKANFEEKKESGYAFENQQQKTNYIGKCTTSCQNSKAHHDVLTTIYGWSSDSTNGNEMTSIPNVNIDDNFESASEDQRKGDKSAGEATNRSAASSQDDSAGATSPSAQGDPAQRNQAEIETPNQSLCEQAKVNADSACDSESKTWMRTINQVSTLLGSQMNAGACSMLAATQAGSAASLSLFTIQCGRAVDLCLTECRKNITSTDEQVKQDATEAVKACNSKGVNAKKTEQEAGSGIQQIAQAVQSCRATFGTAAVDPSLQAPGYVAKPDGDILAGLQQRNDQGLNYEGTGNGLTGDMNANIDLSDLVDDSPTAVAAKPRSMGQDPGGQQGSAGLGSTGGVGVDASSGRAANRKSSSGLFSNILSGFFGSGGGGLFGGGRSSSSGDRNSDGGGYGTSTQVDSKTPDLRQFLPGGKFDPKKERNIAGQIVSKDGLTGPHGNLWRDVSNRYQVKRASLLP